MIDKQNIEAVFPLTPAQTGMLLESQRSRTVFVEQCCVLVEGEVTREALEAAWRGAVDRHTILRTAIAWKSQKQPLHVTFAKLPVTLDWHDLEHRDVEQVEAAKHALLAAERARGIDLAKPPLARLVCARLGPRRHVLCITCHHLALDGWSVSLLIVELLRTAASLMGGHPQQLRAARPFRDYVAWLSKLDRTSAERFWRTTLQHSTVMTPPGIPVEEPAEAPGSWGHATLALGERQSAALVTLARRAGVTLSAVIQALWATLLARYNHREQVVFGATFSGRPLELRGSEDMLGNFITTLPIVARVAGDGRVIELAKALHRYNTQLREFEHTPTSWVREWHESLVLDSVLVFQNYPRDEDGPLRVRGIEFHGAQTRIPVVLLVIPASRIEIAIVHDRSRLNDCDAARLAGHVHALVDAVVEMPDADISTVLERIQYHEIPRIHSLPIALPSVSLPPTSATEIVLASMWSELLGVAGVGTADSFFALGGHSLAATQLVARIDAEFAVRVPLAVLFEMPTLGGLAEWVDQHRRGRSSSVDTRPQVVSDPARRHQPFPLLDIPRAYWMGESEYFELGNIVAHVYTEFRAEGLEVRRLQTALDLLVARHEALRVVIDADGMQRVLAEVPAFPLEVEDLRGLAPALADARVQATRERMHARGPSTSEWPLFDFRCQLLDDGQARVHTAFALAICDGRGSQILFDELCRLLNPPDAALAPLELGLRDYTLALDRLRDTPAWRAAWDHWRARAIELAPPPELPLARLPSSLARQSMSRRRARLDAGTWAALCQRAVAHSLTPNTVLCTAYADVLARWSRSRDFTINVLYSNRPPLHAQANELVGNFSATLLLGLEHRAARFVERARALQARLWIDLEHGIVTGVEVLGEWNRVRGEVGRAGMPVVFASTLGNVATGSEEMVLPAGWRDLASGLVTPQVFIDHNVFQREGALVYHWDVSDQLFPDGLIDSMFAAYHAHLERLAHDDRAWSEARPPLVSTATTQPDAVAAHAVASTASPDTLVSLFEARATNQPERRAVLCTRRTLSYAQLDRESARVAADLIAKGARSGQLIAVVMEKGWEQVVACLAVVRAGAAYLPIDPSLPTSRRQQLLEVGEVEQALTQPWLSETLEWPLGLRLGVVIEPSAGISEIDARQLQARRPAPADLAYVIFTSGSTGTPKGVMIDHRGAVNTILDINRRFHVGPDDCVFALSSLSFDLSVYDIFGMLAAGGSLMLPEPAAVREPARWIELIRQHRVSVWNSVPQLMEMLVEQLAAAPEQQDGPGARGETLRVALLSGDWIPVTLPDRMRARLSNVDVISLGGATEASIWSIVYPIETVDPDWRSIPYGRPLHEQDVLVLDDELAPRPDWVPGELYIAGLGLALGYWRDSEKTAASFVMHPQTGQRLYRTGDLGRRLPDGNIEFLGREDHQVKIQGYRIELGEVEMALGRHPNVRACAVVAAGQPRGARWLVAHLVCDGSPLSTTEIGAFLEQSLPAYMVPRHIRIWDAFPLSSNGKIDRARLTIDAGQTPERRFEPTANVVEDALAGLWREVLDGAEVGRNDDFFALGGTSLRAVQLMTKIRARFGVALPLSILFQGPTIAALADALRPGVSAPSWSPLVGIRTTGSRAPLVLVHPVGGNVLCYRELAGLLGDDQPVYGLQAPSGGERAPVETIDDIAQQYLTAVVELVPHGPVLLGGWSLGGAVAFELARILRARGREVRAVVMLDTRLPRAAERIDDDVLVARFLRDLNGGIDPARPTRDADLEQVRPMFDTFVNNSKALGCYAPSPDAQPVSLFRAAIQPEAHTPDLGWAPVVGPSLEVYEVPGDHYSMLGHPHLGGLASRIRDILDLVADP